MSKIYKLIEDQVNILLRFVLEDEYTGQIQYGKWISGPKWVKPFIHLITTLVFLFVVLFFGLYLWNFGLHPVFPGVVAKIDPMNPVQSSNPYSQLVLTLVALMMFL
jgi:hypothetical protein